MQKCLYFILIFLFTKQPKCCIYITIGFIKGIGLSVHNRIAVLRAERGLSRKQLALAVDVNYQTIGYLERGNYNASLELALKLASYFELPLEMVFSLEPFEMLSAQVQMKTKDH